MFVSAWLLVVAWLAAQTTGPRPEVLKTICATEFGQGDMARVDVLLNKAKAVTVLVLRPDLTRFSHAPHTYFGPDGATLLVVPERPITREQAKSDRLLLEVQALTRDLTAGKPVFCSKHR